MVPKRDGNPMWESPAAKLTVWCAMANKRPADHIAICIEEAAEPQDMPKQRGEVQICTWEPGRAVWNASAASVTSAVYCWAVSDPSAAGSSKSKFVPSMCFSIASLRCWLTYEQGLHVRLPACLLFLVHAPGIWVPSLQRHVFLSKNPPQQNCEVLYTLKMGKESAGSIHSFSQAQATILDSQAQATILDSKQGKVLFNNAGGFELGIQIARNDCTRVML